MKSKGMRNIWIVAILAIIFNLGMAPVEIQGQTLSEKEKKRAELLKKLKKLREEQRKRNEKLRDEREESVTKQKTQQLQQLILRYEGLWRKCKGQKSERCADVIYSLSEFYYNKARDDYIIARQKYEQAMDKWEDGGQRGAEPLNPRPNYSKALEKYKIAVKQYPNFSKADEGWYQIGQIEILNGAIDKSFEAFSKLVEKYPRSIRASYGHFRLAEFYFEQRNFSRCLKHLNKIRGKEVTVNVIQMAHYRKAEVYYNQADFDKAIELFLSYVDKTDRSEYPKKDLRKEALDYTATCFSDIPNGVKEAIKYFQKNGSRSYEDTLIYNVGMKNFNHGQYDNAIIALGEAIKKNPNYFEAPVAQQMIVACYIIRKKHDIANRERVKLVETYKKGSPWYQRNANNPKAVETSINEVKRALAAVPVYFHAIAQERKNQGLYKKALTNYEMYVMMFPDDQWKVYEFKYNMAEIHYSLRQFEDAAKYYHFVADQDLSKFPKFKDNVDTMGLDEEAKERALQARKKSSPVAISQEDAGFNAISSYDELRKAKMATQKLNETQAYQLPETKRFLDYIVVYQQKFKNSTNAPKVLLLAGDVHYGAKNYVEAEKFYQKVVTQYKGKEDYPVGLKMLGNCAVEQKRFDNAIKQYELSMKYYPQNSKERNEVIDLAAGAIYKKGEQLREQKQFAKASETFKSIIKKYPSTKIADVAYFEAGATLETGKMFVKAAETFMNFAKSFPQSKLREKAFVRSAKAYVSASKFKLAAEAYAFGATAINTPEFSIPSYSSASENYEKAGDFEKAGLMFKAIEEKYPTAKETPQAIYNGALVYEKGKIYKRAIEMFELVATKYRDSEYAAEGAYAIGYCYEKMGDKKKMAAAFVDYAEKFSKDRSKQVNALVMASEAYIDMKNDNVAEKHLKESAEIIKKYNKDGVIQPVVVAKTHYMYGRILHNKTNAISLKSVSSQRAMKREVAKKANALEPALIAYTNAVKVGIAEWAIKANYQIGMSYIDFSNDLENQKLFGNSDQRLAGKIQIYSQLEPYYDNAMKQLAWNMDKGFEDGIKNEYIDKSAQEFAKLAYEKGNLFVKIGLLFKNAPCPRGISKDDCLLYKDELYAKYMEAVEQAAPRFKAALQAMKHYGIMNTEWEKKCRDMIREVNPEDEILKMQITERKKEEPKKEENTKQTTPKKVVKKPNPQFKLIDDQLKQSLAKINSIYSDPNLSITAKIQQIEAIEKAAEANIKKENQIIASFKSKLGAKK